MSDLRKGHLHRFNPGSNGGARLHARLCGWRWPHTTAGRWTWIRPHHITGLCAMVPFCLIGHPQLRVLLLPASKCEAGSIKAFAM